MNANRATLNALTTRALQDLWCACWQGGILIAIIAILCRVMPRLPAAARCALWWLACLRLCLGLVWIAPISIPLLPAPAGPTAVPQAIGPADAPVERQPDRLPVVEPPDERSIAVQPVTSSQGGIAALFWDSLLIVWLCGLLWRAGFSLASLRMVRALARNAVVCTDPDLLRAADAIAVSLGMRRVPCLLISAVATEPLAISGRSSSVLMAQADLERLSSEELQAVLAHEFAHIRRADLWLGLAPLMSQLLFWFYPVAWLAGREFAVAREAACDLIALQATRIPPRAYSGLLLKLGANHITSGPTIVPGVTSDFRHLQRRIIMIHQTSGESRRLLSVGLVLLFVGVISLGLIPWRIVAAQTPAKPALLLPWQGNPNSGVPGGPTTRPEETFVTINLSQPLTMALDTAMRASGQGFQVRFDPALTQGTNKAVLAERVTLSEENVPLPTFLQDALDQASIPLTFRYEQGGFVIAPTEPRTRPAVKVPLNLQGVPLDQAVDRLCHAAHVAYRLDLAADVRKLPVTVALKSATVPQALSVLLGNVEGGQGNLYWRREDNFFVVGVNTPSPPTAIVGPGRGGQNRGGNPAPDGGNRLVKIDWNEGELGELLRLHLNTTGWNYVCVLPAEMHDRVNIHLLNVPAAKALDKILMLSPKARQLVYCIQDGIVALAPVGDSGSLLPGFPFGMGPSDTSKMTITLRFKQVDAYAGLKAIFGATRAQFTLDPALRGDKITVTADRATFDDVLAKVAAACKPPMRVKEENEVYSFVPGETP